DAGAPLRAGQDQRGRTRQRGATTPYPHHCPTCFRPGLATAGVEQRSARALRARHARRTSRTVPPGDAARTMTAFDKIRAAARERRGGEAARAARLPRVTPPRGLRAAPDDRYLSLMSRRIFRAGLKPSPAAPRWPAFEEAFRGFVLRRVTA